MVISKVTFLLLICLVSFFIFFILIACYHNSTTYSLHFVYIQVTFIKNRLSKNDMVRNYVHH